MKSNIKFLIWGVFAVITFGMLAWPVAKWMKKDAPQEIFMPEETAKAFDSGQMKERAPSGRNSADSLKPLDTALTRDLYGNPTERAQKPSAYAAPVFPKDTFSRASSSRSSGRSSRRTSSGYGSGDSDAPRATGSKRERAFLRKHYKAIRAYQNRLGALGRKYRAKYPALRKMDAEFSKMDRYMALNRQYAKDGNAFNWARGVLSLPEVRGALIKYSADPQVVQAVVEVSLEAMKNPPPQEIQQEIQHFLTGDPKTSDHVNEVLVQSLGNAMGTLTSMPAQTMAPLQKLGSKIMGNDFAKTMGSMPQ